MNRFSDCNLNPTRSPNAGLLRARVQSQKLLTLVDEYAHEALARVVRRHCGADEMVTEIESLVTERAAAKYLSRMCCEAMVGVRPYGTKDLITLADEYPNSTEHRGDLLRNLKRRWMRSSTLAARDGALGFWAAFPDMLPRIRQQLDWVH